MQYLILLLVLGAALEYVRRERAHRRVIAHVRAHRSLMPSGPATFRSAWFITQVMLALLVFGLALALEFLTATPLLHGLGVALLPVAGLLGLMARQEHARSRQERMQ